LLLRTVVIGVVVVGVVLVRVVVVSGVVLFSRSLRWGRRTVLLALLIALGWWRLLLFW
jgi:hypothetical protein